MADQLSLRLEPDPAGWPAPIRPMLAQPADGPFDDPDSLFEPWWGGERALAYIGSDPADPGRPGGEVAREGRPTALGLRLISADGVLLTERVPEIADLPERLSTRPAILDGTLVAVDEAGRLDEPGLIARLEGRPGPRLAYLVYDLLALDGRSLLSEPLERRRSRLARLLSPSPSIVPVPMIAGEGRALCAAAADQGVGWVLARDRRSPYLAGVRSSLWRLIAVHSDAAASPVSVPPAPAESASSPILALIRRLPLEDQGS
jgi:bifunctional non-homologous end joining protein LigD